MKMVSVNVAHARKIAMGKDMFAHARNCSATTRPIPVVLTMAVRLLLAATSCVSHCCSGCLDITAALCISVVLVAGECVFPSDNPIQDLVEGGTVQAQHVDIHRTYVYTNLFGMCCRGYVRALNFCYRTGNSESEELMTIEIRGPGNSGVRDNYTVMVNSMRDRANCTENYNLGHDFCCVEQTLSESLEVDNKNNFYALRILITPSLLLLHSHETVAGHWEDQHGDRMQGPMINKPLFYFVIDPSRSDGK